MSLRGRLALLSSLAVALTIVAVAGIAYVVVRDRLYDEVGEQLRTRASIHAARGFANVEQQRPLQGPGIPEPPTLPRLIATDGVVIAARYPGLSFPVTADAREVAGGRRGSDLSDLFFRSQHLQVLTVQAGPGRALQLAQSLESVDDTIDTLAVVLAAAAGAGVLLALLAGQLVATGGLRPVRRLTRMTDDVTRTGDLGQRIDVHGRDELASLAASFNAMLEQLERARRAQRQLVADTSHELRTPLTTLRANVELLAMRERTSDGLAADVLAQLDRLTTLSGQLVDLAREDQREPERTPVRLDQLVEQAVERARHHYPAVDFDMRLDETTVLGSGEALGRAVANLLDNAGKWSPDGGGVEVTLGEGELRVRDHGPGIDPADLPRVFERFYRGAARGRPGSGLGLAIVAQVVSAHGGEVRAEHAPGGGATITVTFPAP